MKNLILTSLLLILSFTVFSQNEIALFHKTTQIVNTINDSVEHFEKQTKTQVTHTKVTPIRMGEIQITNSSTNQFQRKSRLFIKKFLGRNPIRITAVNTKKTNYSIFS